VVAENRKSARSTWEAFAAHANTVLEGLDATVSVDARPDWIALEAEPATLAAPDIHAAATSVEVHTGLWRTVRPVLDPEKCNHCTWICAPLCPDGVIGVAPDGTPAIDLDHCKGCMVCAAVCPSHAIDTVPERQAAAQVVAP
jgi:pyruvate ferredoxin oxidoreductase gamma subunit